MHLSCVHLLTCKEVEDENDDEDENDLGSGGRELSPRLRVSPVSKRSIIGSALLSLLPSPIVLVLVVVLVLSLWLEARDSDLSPYSWYCDPASRRVGIQSHSE